MKAVQGYQAQKRSGIRVEVTWAYSWRKTPKAAAMTTATTLSTIDLDQLEDSNLDNKLD